MKHKQSIVNSPVLLIGNGINNVNNKRSWKDSLKKIVSHVGLNNNDVNFKKPFPLLYEEIFIRATKLKHKKELILKREIGEMFNSMKANDLHCRISEMPLKHIITTNYDFLLEGKMVQKNAGVIDEKKYSLFRHYNVEGKKIWHVHGDNRSPATINLGYEHYGGQLQQIRNYIVTGTNYKSAKIKSTPLIKNLQPGHQIQSWLDLFFTSHIYIIGLTLDFIEIDLWWLLTYIARQKYYFQKDFNQSITYFAPSELNGKNKAKFDLFRANGINVINGFSNRNNKDWKGYYHKVIDEIEKQKKRNIRL